jgi:hypothetical protein
MLLTGLMDMTAAFPQAYVGSLGCLLEQRWDDAQRQQEGTPLIPHTLDNRKVPKTAAGTLPVARRYRGKDDAGGH